MTRSLFIILFLLFTEITSGFAQTGINTKENFKREIPMIRGEPDLFNRLTQQKVKELKLDPLENGFDSLQIRIWYDYALNPGEDVIVITRSHSLWTAKFYQINTEWNGTSYDKVELKETTSVKPKSGWNSFIANLFGLGIMTLPNMRDIPGLKDNWTDGVTYIVEVATTSQYRLYEYHLPKKFQDNFPDAKKMVDILQLVDSELIDSPH